MHPRFFSERPISGSELLLSGDEAHHLVRVRRLGVGAVVCLFDGTGEEYQAEVVQTGRHEARLKILQRHSIDRESPVALTLAVALPKGDRQQFLIEKCVELGVARVVPLRTRHSVAEPVESACRRLRRYVIEASKQCGRNRLMQIEEPMELLELLCCPNEANETRWLLDEESSRSAARALPAAVPARLLVAVGPEAGWTDEERGAADAGRWTPISLGSRILRIETAALAIAAWCSLPHNGRR